MQVLVIGGTGTLGRQIAKFAIEAGHQVRCMVRAPRKASFLQEWGAEIVQGDLLDPESVDYALSGIDAVIDAVMSTVDFINSNEVIELDINPLLVLPQGKGAIAVDALVRLN